MMRFDFKGFPGQTDHARVAEDIESMSTLFRDGRARPPLAMLADIGGDLLYAQRGDAGGWGIKRGAEMHALLASIPYRRAFADGLRVNCLHLALVLGRKDLHREFIAAGEMRLEQAMKWLVLYGMDEHRLWRFFDAHFVGDLTKRRIPSPRGALSPLDLILLDEREDLRRLNPAPEIGFARALDEWLERSGAQEYKLFWTLDDAALARMATTTPPWIGRDFVSSLGSAHAEGKADILVMPPGDVAKRLERVSQLSTAAREAALAPPREDDEAEGAHRAPTPLAPGRVNAFDFMPGDPGLAATMNGFLGAPGARGAPILSEMTTFFFAAPRTRRFILTLEAGLADEKASLLVWIDGRPADLFPARALAARAAKVHALRNDATAPLTVGLEIVGGRQAGLFGHLRALALHTVRGGA